jgi:4'-phosphopantetheinyl transferase
MMATPQNVVLVRIDLAAPPLASHVLDRDERARADQFVFDRDRRRFIAAHSALRVSLGEQLGRSPQSLRFVTARHGKPQVRDVTRDVRFNLSHSGERALLAITVGREVGLDIEEHRPADFLLVAQHTFSRQEYAALEDLPLSERSDAFYRCWTRKESFVKARGDGFFFPLDGFDVTLKDRAERLLIACPVSPEDMWKWKMIDLTAEPGYSAALTVEAAGADITIVEHG